jgi:hypothetical protein
MSLWHFSKETSSPQNGKGHLYPKWDLAKGSRRGHLTWVLTLVRVWWSHSIKMELSRAWVKTLSLPSFIALGNPHLKLGDLTPNLCHQRLHGWLTRMSKLLTVESNSLCFKFWLSDFISYVILGKLFYLSKPYFTFSFFFFFGSTGVLAQGLTLARQAFFHLSHSASPAPCLSYLCLSLIIVSTS